MITDPVQRMLLRCALEDALDLQIEPREKCQECADWMESGPCIRHRTTDKDVWPQYLDLSARLETSAGFALWCLNGADLQIIVQAIPAALIRRRGGLDPINVGLRAAYTALAGQLAPATVRR